MNKRELSHLSSLMKTALATKAVSLNWPVLPARYYRADGDQWSQWRSGCLILVRKQGTCTDYLLIKLAFSDAQ